LTLLKLLSTIMPFHVLILGVVSASGHVPASVAFRKLEFNHCHDQQQE